MSNAYFKLPVPINEPVLTYAPGTPEKAELKKKLTELQSKQIEIPLIIGGKEIKTGKTSEIRTPHDHSKLLGVYHKAGAKEVQTAISAALEARKLWAEMPWEHRASVFQKAAELLSTTWRSTLNAATMLGQSKTIYQAEIDSACELIDFWRFNTYYMTQLMGEQPYSPKGMWNREEYRPLEGFVFAVTPFNFTSIAGNLPTAPVIVGNVSLWKPASSAVYVAYFLMKLWEEAGLPAGVINFVPGSGGEVGDPVLASPDLAGIHFTGSTAVFQGMWRTIGENINKAKYYPRIVGETGGKDFIFAHNTADIDALVVGAIRGAFEYQGQKCSAASRAYIPSNLANVIKQKLIDGVNSFKMGTPEDFSNFINAVIDEKSFDKIKKYIDNAKASTDSDILVGGNCDKSVGYFIQPTVIEAKIPDYTTMCEEIFGPVLTIYVYDENKFEETLTLLDNTSPYALTGCIIAQDKAAIELATNKLRNAAGNFYINDKPTGAVVGQQPFGGARASGTNDKAGSQLNLYRWLSARSIKETFNPPTDYTYPFMQEK